MYLIYKSHPPLFRYIYSGTFIKVPPLLRYIYPVPYLQKLLSLKKGIYFLIYLISHHIHFIQI
jgi:hypothetical protein